MSADHYNVPASDIASFPTMLKMEQEVRIPTIFVSDLRRLLRPDTRFIAEFIGRNRIVAKPENVCSVRRVETNSMHELSSVIEQSVFFPVETGEPIVEARTDGKEIGMRWTKLKVEAPPWLMFNACNNEAWKNKLVHYGRILGVDHANLKTYWLLGTESQPPERFIAYTIPVVTVSHA